MRIIIISLLLIILIGCSRQDPITTTPIYHTGAPTNRSSVQSWELNKEPFYTQPGINSGSQVPAPKDIQIQQKYTSYNSLAHQVYAAIANQGIDTRYITVTANKGSVMILGTVDSKESKQKIASVATKAPGVKEVKCNILVIKL